MAKKKTGTPSFIPDPRSQGGNALTDAQKSALVEGCLNLCRKLARKAAGTIPGADVDDLEGDAMLYCVEAANEWQPAVDAAFTAKSKFSTFATNYITKKLKGQAAKQRLEARLARGLNLETTIGTPDEPTDEEPAERPAPTPGQLDLLAKSDEPGRTYVRLVEFEGFTPEQVAEQFGKPVKDIKLALRNAAKQLIRAKAKDTTPSMFAAVAVAEAV